MQNSHSLSQNLLSSLEALAYCLCEEKNVVVVSVLVLAVWTMSLYRHVKDLNRFEDLRWARVALDLARMCVALHNSVVNQGAAPSKRCSTRTISYLLHLARRLVSASFPTFVDTTSHLTKRGYHTIHNRQPWQTTVQAKRNWLRSFIIFAAKHALIATPELLRGPV
jgi:hypothetical protein